MAEVLAGGTTFIKARSMMVKVTVKRCRSGACEVKLVRALQAALSEEKTDRGMLGFVTKRGLIVRPGSDRDSEVIQDAEAPIINFRSHVSYSITS